MLLFMAIYAATGSVVRITESARPRAFPEFRCVRDPVDLAVFGLSSLFAKDRTWVGLAPRDEWIYLLSNVETFLGVVLSGLLGFVPGNRLHRNVF